MSAISFQQLKAKAEAGDSHSQCELGLMYISGQGVPADENVGLGWIQEAIRGGHLEAMFFFAIYNLQGTPSPERMEVARKLLETAGEYRHLRAQLELSKAYLSGNFWPADDKQALKWIRRAASLHNDSACALMGLYFAEKNFPQDALHWLREAAKGGNPSAELMVQDHLAKMEDWELKEDFEGHAKKVLTESLGRPVTDLKTLATELSENPDALAYKTLSIMSDYGYGLPLDPWTASNYLQKAAEAGDAESQWYFAERIRIGYIKNLGESDAEAWEQKSKAAGYAPNSGT